MLLSNQPPMLADQDFQNRHSDMLASARAGVTVDPKVTLTAVRIPHEHVEMRMSEDGGVTWNPPSAAIAIVEASHQKGSILIVEQLAQVLPIGTVFNIENVMAYDALNDKIVRRDFIVTLTAEKGSCCIRLYPPIDMPRTVVELPKRGARLFVRPDRDGVSMA